MTRGNLTWAPREKFSLMTGWDVNYDNEAGDKIEDGAATGDYALYVSCQYSPLSVLSIQPGLRVIYNSIYGAPLIPSNESSSGLSLRTWVSGFPMPGASVHPHSRSFTYDFKDSNHDLSGNKDLKAETTNSYNASFDYRLNLRQSRLGIEPNLFYNDGRDAITLIVTDQENNSATNVNLGGRQTGEAN